MSSTTIAKLGRHHFSLAEQGRALAVVLAEEFETPFAVYDTETGQPLHQPKDTEPAVPAGGWAHGNLDGLEECPVHVGPLTDGRYPITMLGYREGKPRMIAAAQVPALARTAPEVAQEQKRLHRWLLAVCTRLRQADQGPVRRRPDGDPDAQFKTAWEVILTLDHLLRHVRIHRDPLQSQERILQAAFGLLRVRTLVWVPRSADAPVVIQGDRFLSSWDCRQLATLLNQNAEFQAARMLLCNDFHGSEWGQRYPSIRNLMALTVADQGLLGWVLALDKPAEAGSDGVVPFRRSDAALLTPFVGLLQLHQRGSDRYRDLKELLVGLTRSLTAAIDAKDSYTFGHSERVARSAVELGRELGLHEEELSDIYLAGLLHDIGKIGVPDAILGKKGPLTDEEFEQIKQHPTIGYRILADLKPIRHLLPGVLYHHERYDGKGYPEGLAGEAIPLLARVLAVADSYDAMSTARPYRTAMPHPRVEEILRSGSGSQWDPRIIEAFLRCQDKVREIRQRGVGESLRHALDDALGKDQYSVSVAAVAGALPPTAAVE
ncbi:MAG TPA: HD-GYP domain-containing protein [Gemmataceae bacterium]|nr:HD-GYP domain-containing protein [Gemmataceae bacterium]